jgi:hypothetical protein
VAVLPEHGHALLFVSGRYQGTLYALPPEGEVVIGREGEADLVLADDLVSRRHAAIALAPEAVTLRDLGSTNGTFVNGHRVKKAKLALGDRVLVGTSLMKLVPASADTPRTTPIGLPKTRQQAAMAGRIEEIPLPDLIQLVGSSRKSGQLVLRREEEECRVGLRDGKLSGCALSSAPGIAPRKAFWRLLAWEHGSFELVASPSPLPPPELEEEIGPLLMDGIRQLDEWREASSRLPRLEAKVEVAQPLPGKLSDLPPADLDALQAAMAGGTIQSILDRAPEPDVELAKAIGRLIEGGWLRVP